MAQADLRVLNWWNFDAARWASTKSASEQKWAAHNLLTLAQLPPRKITTYITQSKQSLQWSYGRYGYMRAVWQCMGQKIHPTKDNMDGLILFFLPCVALLNLLVTVVNLTHTQRTQASPDSTLPCHATCFLFVTCRRLSPLWRGASARLRMKSNPISGWSCGTVVSGRIANSRHTWASVLMYMCALYIYIYIYCSNNDNNNK